jgi:hypothetical protein
VVPELSAKGSQPKLSAEKLRSRPPCQPKAQALRFPPCKPQRMQPTGLGHPGGRDLLGRVVKLLGMGGAGVHQCCPAARPARSPTHGPPGPLDRRQRLQRLAMASRTGNRVRNQSEKAKGDLPDFAWQASPLQPTHKECVLFSQVMQPHAETYDAPSRLYFPASVQLSIHPQFYRTRHRTAWPR